jgi:hypothetical protein
MIVAFLCGAFYGALVCMVYKKRGRRFTVEETTKETMSDWLSEWEAAGTAIASAMVEYCCPTTANATEPRGRSYDTLVLDPYDEHGDTGARP